MRFIEETETAWSAEQLAAAEREIEEQKREWEENRLAAMREEEKRRARQLEEDADLLTFSREDATNQVSNKPKKVTNGRNKKVVRRVKGMRGKVLNVKVKRKKLSDSCTESDPDVIVKRKVRSRVSNRLAKRKEVIEPDSTTQTSVSDNDGPKMNGDDSLSQWTCDSDIESIKTESEEFDSESQPFNKKASVTSTNHIDHNSPRTRSHGTVAINLWTLDVSPILPGVKPIVKNSVVVKRERSRNSSSEKEVDVETVGKHKRNNNSLGEQSRIIGRRKRRRIGELIKRKKLKFKSAAKNVKAAVNSVTSSEVAEGEKGTQKVISKCKEKVCKVVVQDVAKYLPKNNSKNVDITENLDKEVEVEIANSDKTASTSIVKKDSNKLSSPNRKLRNHKNCNNKLDGWLQKSPQVGKLGDNSILRTNSNEPKVDKL